MNRLSIRKVLPEDSHFINALWKDITDEDLIRLGELERPDPLENIKFLEWFCKTPNAPTESTEDIRVWCVDGSAAGYSTLKRFKAGGDGQIHLHMTRPYWRKGFGSVLFCLSALEFHNTYQLKNLYCQPRLENPMPNGMLAKVGFPLIGKIEYKRKDGSTILQNQYRIDLPVIKKYLENAKGRFSL